MEQRKIANVSIVVGIDASGESGLALEWAAHEAARRHVPLEILCAYRVDQPVGGVAPPGTALPTMPTDLMRTPAERACAAATASARALHPDLVVTASPEPASPGGALVEASRTAGMIVVGARGLGPLRSIALGSVSIHVAAHARCPVVVVREAATGTLARARVIVGVDGYGHSTGAIRFAFEHAAERGLGVTVVHTWRPGGAEAAAVTNERSADSSRLEVEERSLLSEAIAGYREEFPTVDVRRHAIQRHPVEELVRLSENASLLVLGTRGRGSVAGWIEGSVSQGVLRRAHCPVAVVHPLTDVSEKARVRRSLHLSGASDT